MEIVAAFAFGCALGGFVGVMLYQPILDELRQTISRLKRQRRGL